MNAVDSFTAGPFRFVDFHNAPREDVLAGKEILWRLLQFDILDRLRPGVGLCRAGSEEHQGCDPSKGSINFVVYERRAVVGMFNLYNLERDPDVRDGVRAAAMPGFRPTSAWGRILRFIIENDLVQDGRTLDLTSWDHPAFEGHRWFRDPIADAAIAELEAAGHTVERRSDGSPSRTRKRRVDGRG